MKLLLVEDDIRLGETVKRALEGGGYTVDWVRRGDDAVAAAGLQHYGVLLLDLSLPHMSGLDVLREIRRRPAYLPVIIVTAQDRPTHRIAGLDAGADDYLVKPFDLDELIARVRAQVRRQDGRSSDLLFARNVRLDLAGRTMWRDDASVAITAREFKLAALLMRRSGRFVSKEEIEAALYDDSAEFESNTVEVAISALRRKLGRDFIVTARGLGYTVPK